jgi:hypothetical protein
VISGTNPYNSTLYVFPAPDVVYRILRLVYVDAIQDMDSSTDDIDLPQEWYYPVVWNLAAELGYPYGKFTELEKIQPKADQMYDLIKNQSSDNTAIKFTIDGRNR